MQREVKSNEDLLKQKNQAFPDVISLNVGGSIFTTTVATLHRFPKSMLSAMFSGRHHLVTDNQGRYFIDRDGRLFLHILNFLRQGELPPLEISWKVYEEAQFYNLVEMCKSLEVLRPVAGEKLRRKFLQQIPSYHFKLESLLLEAQKYATFLTERISKLKVCVYKEEQHLGSSELNATANAGATLVESNETHNCDVDMTFGPWKGSLGVYDVIDCIRHDLSMKGYDVECQCIGVCDIQLHGQHYCKRPIFEFKFRWW